MEIRGCNPKMIECDGLVVEATVEANEAWEHPIYYPANMLMFIKQ